MLSKSNPVCRHPARSQTYRRAARAYWRCRFGPRAEREQNRKFGGFATGYLSVFRPVGSGKFCHSIREIRRHNIANHLRHMAGRYGLPKAQ
jgi:hypothetical protein